MLAAAPKAPLGELSFEISFEDSGQSSVSGLAQCLPWCHMNWTRWHTTIISAFGRQRIREFRPSLTIMKLKVIFGYVRFCLNFFSFDFKQRVSLIPIYVLITHKLLLLLCQRGDSSHGSDHKWKPTWKCADGFLREGWRHSGKAGVNVSPFLEDQNAYLPKGDVSNIQEI